MQRERVERETRQLLAENEKTRRAIDKLEDEDQKAVAINRYINRQKWNDIADIIHISRAQLFRVHDKMLEAMAKILQEEGFAI